MNLERSSSDEKNKWECPVCFNVDVYPMTLYKCGHSACVECLPKLNSQCPICRGEISDAIPNYTLGSYLNLKYEEKKEEKTETVIEIDPDTPNFESTNSQLGRLIQQRIELKRKRSMVCFFGLCFGILFVIGWIIYDFEFWVYLVGMIVISIGFGIPICYLNGKANIIKEQIRIIEN